jgi:hypothetical protein
MAWEIDEPDSPPVVMKAVKTVQDGGDPPGVAPTYYKLRAHETVLPKGVDGYAAKRGALSGEGTPTSDTSLALAAAVRD